MSNSTKPTKPRTKKADKVPVTKTQQPQVKRVLNPDKKGPLPIRYSGQYAVPIMLKWIDEGIKYWGDYARRKDRSVMSAEEIDLDRRQGLVCKLQSIKNEAHLELPEEDRIALGDRWVTDDDGIERLNFQGSMKNSTLNDIIARSARFYHRKYRSEQEVFEDVRYKLLFCHYHNRIGFIHLLWHLGITMSYQDVWEFLTDTPLPSEFTEQSATPPAQKYSGEKEEYLDYVRAEFDADREPVLFGEWRESRKEATVLEKIKEFVSSRSLDHLKNGGDPGELPGLIDMWTQEAKASLRS